MTRAKIVKWARLMRGVADVVLVAVPLVLIATMVFLPAQLAMFQGPPGLQVSPDATRTHVALAQAVGMVPLAIAMWTLWQMRRLFALYANGVVLTLQAARQIRRVGQGFLILALLPLIVIPAQSVLLSWANPEGQRSLSVTLDDNMLVSIIVSGFLILIGWAMAQAADVAAENESFV